MKRLKALFSTLVAMFMVFSMSATAIAGETNGNSEVTTPAVTVTIDPQTPTSGTSTPTYTYYVMMKASVGTAGTSYYVESEDLATALNALTIDGNDLFTVTKASGANRWNVEINPTYKDSGEQVATALQSIKTKAIATGDATNNSINLDYDGYILIESSLGTTLVLDTVTTKTIKEKNQYPSVTKTEDKKTAEIGQDVTYTVPVVIPQNVAEKTITITDTITKGLTINAAATVSGGVDNPAYTSATWTKEDSQSNDSAVYTITIPADVVKANAGKTLTFTYTATVNENAVVNVPETNKVKIAYDSYTSVDTPEVAVKTFGFELNKTDGTSALPGVKFTLQNSANEYYTVPSDNSSIDEDRFVATKYEVTTPSDGKISFVGLAAGTYTLTETDTVDGYNLLTGAITVNVAENGNVTFTGNGQTSNGTTVTVVNNAGSTLPSTGGIGTTIFYIVGGVMVAGAAIFLLTKRRMSGNAQ